MRKNLLKILANVSDDLPGTITALEEYIRMREDDAVKTYILAGSPRAIPIQDIAPARTEGERVSS